MAPRDRTPKLLTAEHLYSIAEDGRTYELDEGELVVMEPPVPEHGRVELRIGALLFAFVEARGLGVVYSGDPGFVLAREPDTVRGPDVAFLRAERAPRGEDAKHFYEGAPDLAVEVLSPSDRPGPLAKKVQNYLDTGTQLVWVVDPYVRKVVVHAPGEEPRILGAADEIDGADVLPGFRSPVAAFFGSVA
jgi:Uma2 family endonuclease